MKVCLINVHPESRSLFLSRARYITRRVRDQNARIRSNTVYTGHAYVYVYTPAMYPAQPACSRRRINVSRLFANVLRVHVQPYVGGSVHVFSTQYRAYTSAISGKKKKNGSRRWSEGGYRATCGNIEINAGLKRCILMRRRRSASVKGFADQPVRNGVDRVAVSLFQSTREIIFSRWLASKINRFPLGPRRSAEITHDRLARNVCVKRFAAHTIDMFYSYPPNASIFNAATPRKL